MYHGCDSPVEYTRSKPSPAWDVTDSAPSSTKLLTTRRRVFMCFESHPSNTPERVVVGVDCEGGGGGLEGAFKDELVGVLEGVGGCSCASSPILATLLREWWWG